MHVKEALIRRDLLVNKTGIHKRREKVGREEWRIPPSLALLEKKSLLKKKKAEEKARKRTRRPGILPQIEQPGELDDPLRRVLSGAGVHWYL